MPNRTAEANKAILAAWENEQKRVSEGNGTRDWTQKQQQDILERGKAYDENGKAFHGQHMRSAEKHPEFQGDPNNIQFLTKDEHLAAHDGDWRNPTNWYYDPVTKTKLDFGDGPIIPCSVIELSQPIRVSDKAAVGKVEEDISKGPELKEQSEPRAPPIQERPHVQSTRRPVRPQTPPPHLSFGRRLWNGTKRVAKTVGDFIWDNKGTILEIAGPIVASIIAEKVSEPHDSAPGGESSINTNERTNILTDTSEHTSINTPSYTPPVTKNYPETHASPQGHMVPAHGQHYHTNNGVIWKDKDPYPRGGNNSNK